MSEESRVDELERRADAAEAALLLLMGVLRGSHGAALDDAAAGLDAWLRPRAPPTDALASDEWREMHRLREWLAIARDDPAGGHLPEDDGR